MNAGKTKFMLRDQRRMGSLQTNDGTKLEEVNDFKYLRVRGWKAQQRILSNAKEQCGEHAVSKLSKIRKSSLPSRFKLRLFAPTVESVLLYGCEA